MNDEEIPDWMRPFIDKWIEDHTENYITWDGSIMVMDMAKMLQELARYCCTLTKDERGVL